MSLTAPPIHRETPGRNIPLPPNWKRCSRCARGRPTTHFYLETRGRLRADCKDCQRIARGLRRETGEKLEYDRRWRAEHRDSCLESSRRYSASERGKRTREAYNASLVGRLLNQLRSARHNARCNKTPQGRARATENVERLAREIDRIRKAI